MQTINLDLSVKSIIPLLHAKQADVGRKFKVILSDGGAAYPLPAGAAVSVWYSGASGEGNYTDVGANSAVSVSGNEIVVEMIAQMLANYGVGTVCIVIHTADGDQLGTWNIPYMVEPLPGMGSAAVQAYFTAFSNAVQNLPYPDASLSAPGKAADAAATGAALAGKAPAGYGLGMTSCEAITSLAALDATVKNGKYYLRLTGSEIIAGAYQYGNVEVTGHDNWDVTQTLIATGNTTKLSRRGRQGNWQPWEYENPPMVPGVEYRTTERYDGKPVYYMLVSCGTIASNTATAIKYSDNANCRAISVSGGVSNGMAMQTGLQSPVSSDSATGAGNEILLGSFCNYITAKPNFTSTNVSVIVKYYKTTD